MSNTQAERVEALAAEIRRVTPAGGCSSERLASLLMPWFIAENEALRADAERYRWLREQHWVEPEARFRLGLSDETEDSPQLYEAELNSAIDGLIQARERPAARNTTQQHGG